jgi:hypothetical protein
MVVTRCAQAVILSPSLCHPERSEGSVSLKGKLREGSLRPASQTLRCAQGDSLSLPLSAVSRSNVILSVANDLACEGEGTPL